ncbi:hypothetical protein BABINDRAFT_41350 [Babjeviella inositovora NRRL Y-12698]|uniref:Pyridoxamine 5'-phosphate oxidase Alr4036 family FMN-binding domain-containing protein n=1 Tax=Babjeviella inositovora NRRL Y-12698 TaxID=984486 RepID=A0A1E3QJE4_9ASCO|nr:uncharacterized protein BABINDRAFT_41350 [Babjeviella inositovora NRRL Y-12698]ODQ77574.1 hypothetical protein BABINDRAFT_41350 [Babjeviella inositovora NRRL Y-12698]
MLQQLQIMASWVPSFKSALEAEQPNAPFISFQLATVDAQGFPHSRTCVFRGFLFDDHKTNILTFTTDLRLEKIEQLRYNDRFEAVFYLPSSSLQFRFQGRAKVLSKTHHPVVKLPTHLHIDDEDISTHNSSNSDDDNEDKGSGNDEPGLSFNIKPSVPVQRSESPCPESFFNTPIVYPLVSRQVLTNLTSHSVDKTQSFANLHELPLRLIAPTTDEWNAEFTRHWSSLSRSLRSSFRKPCPGSALDSEKRSLLDKIARGVDGIKESEGQARFGVVCLFVEKVDYVKLGYSGDSRWIIAKEEGQDLWKEEEVCP